MHASYRGSYGNRDNEAHEVRSDEEWGCSKTQV